MALAAENLRFGYRPGVEVLRGVSAAFQAGSVTAIVGPNGAGKSTLLRLLAGVLKPQSGKIAIDGAELGSMPLRERARRVAYVAQRSLPAFAYTVREYVGLGRYAAGEADDGRAVTAAIQTVELADRSGEAVAALSVGQQQRAALARALAQLDLRRPPAGTRSLLLDEPVSAMDPRHSLHTLTLLGQLARAGVAVVAVLHDFGLVSRFCDRVLVLDHSGAAVAAGPTREAMSPAAMEAVFGVPFELAQAGRAGAVLVPHLEAPSR